MNPTETNSNVNLGDSQFIQLMAQANGEAGANGPPALSSTPTVSGLMNALRRRWLTAVGAGTVAMLLAILAVFQLMPPKYVVSIRVRVIAKQAGPDDIEFPIYKANMESLMKSPRVIKAALAEKLPDGREIGDLDIVRSKGFGAVDWLEKALKTDFLLGPEILKVTLAADHPQEAADLLNAISKAFLNECAEMDRTRRQQRIAELHIKKDRIVEDLRLHRLNLQQTMEELNFKDNNAADVIRQAWLQKQATAETIKRTNDEEIAKAQAEVVGLESKLGNVKDYKVPQDILDEAFARDRLIETYYKHIVKLDEDINVIRQTHFEPSLTTLSLPLKKEKEIYKHKIAERKAELQPTLEKRFHAKVREEIEYQLLVMKDKRDAYQARSAVLQKDVQDLMQKVKDSGDLIRNRPARIVAIEEKIDVARLSLNQAAQKIGEVELEVPGSRVQLVGPAVAPMDKDISRQSKVAGAGAFAMFGLMLFGVAMLEFRTRKIGMVEDVAHGLGLKVVGTIPALPAPGRKPDPVRDAQWQNQLHESVDAIRTVLLHNAKSEKLRVILVTSANAGEGKTTLSTQLAASLARAWKRTLIIDGDLRHPDAHKLFDVPVEPGLAEVLRGEVDVADGIRATPLSRLWILPAGNGDAHAIQALAQDNVTAIFESLKGQYDYIIVDSPPVLPVTDTLLLGEHVDGVIFSILRDVSRAPAVHAAQQKLAPLEIHTLGAVILGAEAEFGDKNYRYVMPTAK